MKPADMIRDPNALQPCGTSAARIRHNAHGQPCRRCDKEATVSRDHTDVRRIVCTGCGKERIRATDTLCWDCWLGVAPAATPDDNGHEPGCPYPDTDAADCAICAAIRRRRTSD